MPAYTKLSYAETTSVQLVDNLIYLSCAMLYNSGNKIPRVLATLATHSYKKLELRFGQLLNSEDFDNFLIFIKKYTNNGSTVTITDNRSFNIFLSKVIVDRHKEINTNLSFDYLAQIVNEDLEVLRNVRLHKLTDIVNNAYSTSFVSLTIRKML